MDDCYEAATDASDYAGSVSGGDSDNDHDDHDKHSPPEFYDDKPGSEVVDDVVDKQWRFLRMHLLMVSWWVQKLGP